MPYVGSYIWKIRQKIGHDPLIMPSADAIAVREDGKLMLVFNKDFNGWFFPGGYVEEGQTSQECAARELLEEAGLEARSEDLVPFAFASGHRADYPNGDVTYPFTQCFIARAWRDAGSELDFYEVTERRWFSIDEIMLLDQKGYTLKIAESYERYLETGEYQILDMKNQ